MSVKVMRDAGCGWVMRGGRVGSGEVGDWSAVMAEGRLRRKRTRRKQMAGLVIMLIFIEGEYN